MTAPKSGYFYDRLMRREIQNPQMFETDPESLFPAIYFSYCFVVLALVLVSVKKPLLTKAEHFSQFRGACKKFKKPQLAYGSRVGLEGFSVL
jgi:hypothetical protein